VDDCGLSTNCISKHCCSSSVLVSPEYWHRKLSSINHISQSGGEQVCAEALETKRTHELPREVEERVTIAPVNELPSFNRLENGNTASGGPSGREFLDGVRQILKRWTHDARPVEHRTSAHDFCAKVVLTAARRSAILLTSDKTAESVLNSQDTGRLRPPLA
jgi:hypothetical protein